MIANYLPLIVDALADAALIFFVAVGLTLVFSVVRILNVAHGSFYALGAYLSVVIGTILAAPRLADLEPCRVGDQPRCWSRWRSVR